MSDSDYMVNQNVPSGPNAGVEMSIHTSVTSLTSCARGDTICLCLRIYSPGGTCSGMFAI